MPREIKSPAKRQIIDLVKQCGASDVPMNYEFEFDGPLHKATPFVQHMRVELSRFRARVLDNGGTPKRFRIELVNVQPLEPNKQRITLLFRPPDTPSPIMTELESLFKADSE